MNQLKGFLALLLAALIFGSYGILVRLLSQDFTSFQQMGVKNLGALLFAIIFTLALKQKWSIGDVKKVPFILFIGSYFISLIGFTLAVLFTKVSTAIFGLYVGSLLSSLGAGVWFFKEKITPYKIFSLVLVFIGLYIYVYPLTMASFNIGLLLGILSGVMDTVTNGVRKSVAGKIDRFFLIVLQMGTILGLCMVMMLFSGELYVPTISLQSWVVAVVYGFLTVATAFLTLYGFQNFDLNLGSVILSAELFFGAVAALVLFNEVPTQLEVIGGIFIIAAIVVLNLNPHLIHRYLRDRKKMLA